MNRWRRRVRRAPMAWRALVWGLTLAVPAVGPGCRPEAESEAVMPKRDINAVMEDHVDSLMAIPGVTGVAIGALEDGAPYIMVLLLEDTEAIRGALPDSLEGYPVRPRVSGEIRPMDSGD